MRIAILNNPYPEYRPSQVAVQCLGDAAEIRNVARKADAVRLAAGRVWVPIRRYQRPADTCWIGRLLSDASERL